MCVWVSRGSAGEEKAQEIAGLHGDIDALQGGMQGVRAKLRERDDVIIQLTAQLGRARDAHLDATAALEDADRQRVCVCVCECACVCACVRE